MMRFAHTGRVAATALALALSLAACGDDRTEETTTRDDTATARAAAGDDTTAAADSTADEATAGGSVTEGGVTITGAWARTSPTGADRGAAYLTISSTDAVSIVSASVPTDIAGTVELHETVPADDPGASSEGAMEDGGTDESAMDEGGTDESAMDEGAGGDGAMEEMAMTMRPVDSIDVPAGGSVALEPGGLHVMLLDLPTPLEPGQTFELTLTTADGDEIVIPVEVMDMAP